MKVRMIDWEKKKKKKADDWNKKWIFFFSTKGNKKNETVHKFTNEKQKKKTKNTWLILSCAPQTLLFRILRESEKYFAIYTCPRC